MITFKNEAERFDTCHSLGNLAAMDSKENKDNESFDFAQKKPIISSQSTKLQDSGRCRQRTGMVTVGY